MRNPGGGVDTFAICRVLSKERQDAITVDLLGHTRFLLKDCTDRKMLFDNVRVGDILIAYQTAHDPDDDSSCMCANEITICATGERAGVIWERICDEIRPYMSEWPISA